MEPYLKDADLTLYQGDALEVLRGLPDESVHMCVTSPPFYGLRDYGTGRWEGGNPDCDHLQGRPGSGRADGIVDERMQRNRDGAGAFKNVCKCGASRVDQQIGLEGTPEQWVEKLVAVFREVRRVLRRDGTCWVEVGDSYAANRSYQVSDNKHKAHDYGESNALSVPEGLKPKDLIGAPWMLAEALKAPYYTGRIGDEGDRKWLAAIIDGEGSIQIHKRPAGTRSYSTYEKADGTVSDYKRLADSYQPKLEISNTNIALLERVIELTGEGKTTTKQLAGTFGRKQTIYRWCVTADKARALLREVYPHLVAKQHEARLAYSCPSSGDVAGQAHEALKALHQGGVPDVDLAPPATLFERGWFLRSDIVWSRRPQPNSMPESVTDRPTKSHSYVFLLSKSARYFFDQEAVREPHTPDGRIKTVHEHLTEGSHPNYDNIGNGNERWPNSGRNVRSVWSIPTQAYSEAHFATFPEELVRRCILAGTSEWGCCPECGAPWARNTGRSCPECADLVPTQAKECPGCGFRNTEWRGQRETNEAKRAGESDTVGPLVARRRDVTPKGRSDGWKPGCAHGLGSVPCTVLDCFAGSGTTGLVARKHDRRSILIELNVDYCELVATRTRQLSLLSEVT